VAWNTGAQGVIKLWDTQAIKLDRTYRVGATSLAFSPNGRYLAAVTVKNALVVWDLDSDEIVREIGGCESSINTVLFDPESEYLITGSDDGGLRSWDTNQWRMQSSIELDTRIKCLTFTAGGEYLITGNANSACYVLSAGCIR
jgi:WD40 repeat protein